MRLQQAIEFLGGNSFLTVRKWGLKNEALASPSSHPTGLWVQKWVWCIFSTTSCVYKCFWCVVFTWKYVNLFSCLFHRKIDLWSWQFTRFRWSWRDASPISAAIKVTSFIQNSDGRRTAPVLSGHWVRWVAEYSILWSRSCFDQFFWSFCGILMSKVSFIPSL